MAILVIKATTVLHNYLSTRSDRITREVVDDVSYKPTLAEGFKKIVPNRGNRGSNDAVRIREMFMRYFNQEGAIPHQRKAAGLTD